MREREGGERERDKQTDREKEREGDGEREIVWKREQKRIDGWSTVGVQERVISCGPAVSQCGGRGTETMLSDKL